MAVTRTDHTLSAGFSATDILNGLGSAFADLGVLSSPTAWHDSFTDTNGSEVRIVAQTRGTGTRNTLYSAFFVKTNGQLWYSHYYNWDTITHESQGNAYYDHAGTYEHPDDTTSTSFSTNIATLNNSSDATISALISAEGNLGFVNIKNASESRTFGTALDSATLDPNVPVFNDVGPSGWFGVTVPGGFQGISSIQPILYAGLLHVLKADLLLGYGDNGVSTSDFTVASTFTGMISTGNITSALISTHGFDYFLLRYRY